MPITLAKIAAEVGVDRSLVSRVLRGDPKARLSEAKREQILALSKAIGYRPNRVGRSLRTGRTFIIGMLTPDVTNPFHSVLFRGVEAVATEVGYDTILCNTDDNADRFMEVVSVLSEGHVDGLLVASAHSDDPAIDWLAKLNLPYILVNRRRRDGVDPWIGPDDFQTGWLAGEHLLARGHTRILLLIGSLDHQNLCLRAEGLGAAVKKFGPRGMKVDVVDGLETRAAARDAVVEYLERPADVRPTAIFAPQTHTTAGALHAIYRSGLRIPQDISIVGYSATDDSEVTFIRTPVDQIGRLAAKLLIDHLQRSEKIKPADINITLPVTLLDRGSTAQAPSLGKTTAGAAKKSAAHKGRGSHSPKSRRPRERSHR